MNGRVRSGWVAIVVCGLGACGAGPGSQRGPDAGAADDARPIDAMTGAVTVTTYQHDVFPELAAQPASGVQIVVSSAVGDVVGDVETTDAQGRATVTVADGDSVTAIYRTAGATTIVTFAAVEIGDDLTFGTAYWPSNQIPESTMNASWPDVAGASEVDVLAGPCGWWFGADPTAPHVAVGVCPPDLGPVTFTFTALDAARDLIAWGRADDVSFVADGAVPLARWQAPAPFTLEASQLPDDVLAVDLEATAVLGSGGSFRVGNRGMTSGGALAPSTLPFIAHPDSVRASATYDRSNAGGSQVRFETLAGDATAFHDDHPPLLPWLTAVTADAATERVALSIDGADATGTYDSIVLDAAWTRGAPYRWRVILPPGITTFHLPKIDASGDERPLTADGLTVQGRLFDHGWADYHATRTHSEQEIVDPGASPTATVRISEPEQ